MRIVIPCLDDSLAERLDRCLPFWLVPEARVCVVTLVGNVATIEVAKNRRVDDLVFVSAADRSAAIDAGFCGTRTGEMCVAVDADLKLVGELPRESHIMSATLYVCRCVDEFGQEESLDGRFYLFRFSSKRRSA